jgi:subtilisin-like proprotein convertase family protein
MRKVIRLTESDLVRLVKRIINEQKEFETEESLLSIFGHCKGRTEKLCEYEEGDWRFKILDDDPDIDIKLKRIGLKIGKGWNFYTVKDINWGKDNLD